MYRVLQKLGHWLLRVKKVSNISQGSVVTCLRCGVIVNIPLYFTMMAAQNKL